MRFLLILIFVASSLLSGEEIFATFDVIANKSTKLAMQSSGIVSEINVKIGDKVKAGQLLARLDSSSEQIALNLAKKSIEFAKSSFQKIQNVKTVTSKQSFDEAKFNYDKAILEGARLEDMISKKNLYAPFDGVIVSKLVEVGDGVGAIVQPLFIMQSFPEVKLLIGIDSKYSSKVKLNDEFRFEFENKKYSTRISNIYPNIEPKNQKIYLEAITTGLKVGDFGEGILVVN